MTPYCCIPPTLSMYGCIPNPYQSPLGYTVQQNKQSRGISQLPEKISSQQLYTLWRILIEVEFTTEMPREIQVLGAFPIELRRLIFEQYIRLVRKEYLASLGKEKEYSVGDYINQHGQPTLIYNNTTLPLNFKGITTIDGLEQLNQSENILDLDLRNNLISSTYDVILDPFVQYVVGRLGVPIFRNLINMKTLNLTDNQLRMLPVGVFEGLHSLERLYLSRNQLGVLPVGIFNGLQNLKQLNLTRNYLNVTEEEFRHMHGLGSNIRIVIYPQNVRVFYSATRTVNSYRQRY